MAETSTMQPAASGDLRELRLALVCYGGVSLAIYMRGVTKELHRLLLASAAYAPFSGRWISTTRTAGSNSSSRPSAGGIATPESLDSPPARSSTAPRRDSTS